MRQPCCGSSRVRCSIVSTIWWLVTATNCSADTSGACCHCRPIEVAFSKKTPGAAMKIVIPGGSGQVGTLLARQLHAEGHDVVVLSREPQASPWRVVRWDGA